MQMINEALSPEALAQREKLDELLGGKNRHERRAEEAQKRKMDALVAELQQAGRDHE